jgi:hypothetical protein
MACPCCGPSELCVLTDPRTSGCTYTVSIHTYTIFLGVGNTTDLRIGPQTQGYLCIGTEPNCDFFVGPEIFFHRVNVLLKDCPTPLPDENVFPNVGVDDDVLKSTQGCDVSEDSPEAASGQYHLAVRGITEHNVADAALPKKVWLYKINAGDDGVSAELVWSGNTGVPYPQEFVRPEEVTLRCLPCNWTSPNSFPVLTFDGQCPHDITQDTPTITISCPP